MIGIALTAAERNALREAIDGVRRQRIAEARRRVRPVPEHGTETGYSYGCRCPVCALAASQARAARL